MWDTAIYLIVLGIWDARKKEIPVIFLLLGGIYVVCNEIYRVIVSSVEIWEMFLKCIPGMIPGFFLLATAWITQKAGYGDGIVLLLLGVREGLQNCLLMECMSLFLLSIFAGICLVSKKKSKNAKIPYLPFLCIVYLFNPALWNGGML